MLRNVMAHEVTLKFVRKRKGDKMSEGFLRERIVEMIEGMNYKKLREIYFFLLGFTGICK